MARLDSRDQVLRRLRTLQQLDDRTRKQKAGWWRTRLKGRIVRFKLHGATTDQWERLLWECRLLFRPDELEALVVEPNPIETD